MIPSRAVWVPVVGFCLVVWALAGYGAYTLGQALL